jgi:hypothetical protein
VLPAYIAGRGGSARGKSPRETGLVLAERGGTAQETAPDPNCPRRQRAILSFPPIALSAPALH